MLFFQATWPLEQAQYRKAQAVEVPVRDMVLMLSQTQKLKYKFVGMVTNRIETFISVICIQY